MTVQYWDGSNYNSSLKRWDKFESLRNLALLLLKEANDSAAIEVTFSARSSPIDCCCASDSLPSDFGPHRRSVDRSDWLIINIRSK